MLHYAYIARPIHHVSVTPTAGGTASPLSADVIHGAELELTAIPDANYQFDLWDGDVVSLSPTLALTVDRDINLNARFSPIAVTDGFETGNLQHLGWTAGGNKPWVVQNIHVATGTWAARSGVIGHGQSSSLILTSNFRAGTGSFTRRVSSEQYYDFLRFYLDGVLMQSWSGEAVWANYTFSITAGTHTLEWRYAKDGSGTSGEDAVFIDNVILPIIVSPDATTPADLTLRQLSDGSYFVELEGQANQQYVMQSSTNLASWQNLSTNIATSGHIYVPLPASSRPVQYYRAVVFP